MATEEFATHGLSGARVDAIAERTRTSKRMIYYYFKGKEGLYRAVLEKAYSEIRSLDSQEGIEDAEPVEAIRKHHRDHVRLRRDASVLHQPGGVENVHQGRNIAQAALDQAAQRQRDPRADLDPGARREAGRVPQRRERASTCTC